MSTLDLRLVSWRTLPLGIATATLLMSGCNGGATETLPLPLQSIYVANHIYADVHLTSQGRSLGILRSGRSMDVMVHGLSVDWTRGPFTLPDGKQATDDEMMSGTASPDFSR